jgi:hypothetical protein
MTTAVAIPEPHEPSRSVVPTGAHLDAMIRVSEMLASSSLVPAAYRGKAANVLLASLAGQPFGWDPTMSMRSFHIIEGSPSLKPEVMLALVRRAGHSVSGDTSPTGATITGTRRDSGDSMTVTFTMEDAKRAGLAGKRGPWTQYPASMCWARALSQLCRMLFPDVVLGAGYTPEELGAFSNDDPMPTVVTAAPAAAVGDDAITVGEAKRRLLAAAGGDKDVARRVWDEARMDGEAAIELDAIEVLCERAVELAAAEVVDAEIVEEAPAPALDDLGAEWATTEPGVAA